MSVKLTDNRILIEPDEVETKTSGGIFIPNADKENTLVGTVISIGPGTTTKSGKVVPIEINVGERVLYIRDTGDKVVLDGKNLLILKEDEILAIVND